MKKLFEELNKLDEAQKTVIGYKMACNDCGYEGTLIGGSERSGVNIPCPECGSRNTVAFLGSIKVDEGLTRKEREDIGIMAYNYHMDGVGAIDILDFIVDQYGIGDEAEWHEIEKIIKAQGIKEGLGIKGGVPAPSQLENPLLLAINFAKATRGHGAHGQTYYNTYNKDLFRWLDDEVLPKMGYPSVIQLSNGDKVYVTYSDIVGSKQWHQAVNIQHVLGESLQERKGYTQFDVKDVVKAMGGDDKLMKKFTDSDDLYDAIYDKSDKMIKALMKKGHEEVGELNFCGII